MIGWNQNHPAILEGKKDHVNTRNMIIQICYEIRNLLRHEGKMVKISLSGISLGMCPANEEHRYNITMSLIGWVHT